MSYIPTVDLDDPCDHCNLRKPVCYLVKHPETVAHWRCQKCFNSLAWEGKPLLVIGIRTKNQSTQKRVSYLGIYRVMRHIARQLDRE